jgi:putative transposase
VGYRFKITPSQHLPRCFIRVLIALIGSKKAIGRHGVPEKITIDKSGAKTAATVSYNADHDTDVEIREVKYLNNIIEQDHPAIKRRVRAILGFKAFWSAAITIAGIEIMHMIRKGQLQSTGKLRPAQQFYALAA